MDEKYCSTSNALHKHNRLALGKVSPPTSRNRPEPESDFAHGYVSIFVSAKLHGSNLNAFSKDANIL